MVPQPGQRIDGVPAPVPGLDLEVEVVSGGVAGGADFGDLLPGLHVLADGDEGSSVTDVRVAERDRCAVDGGLDDDEISEAAGPCGEDDYAVGGFDRIGVPPADGGRCRDGRLAPR